MNKNNTFSEDFFTTEIDQKLVLSGAAAAARGAYEANAGLILTYPGSPVVETYDVLANPEGPIANRCRIVINEHVAWHKSLGYSLSGGRSFLIMKHVGFHVASDPAHYSGYTGVKGGMVIVVGDDAGANCSTGEFDLRFNSLHTHLPILEPADFSEAAILTKDAFTLSEKLQLPVIILLPAALCYGMGTIITKECETAKKNCFFENSDTLTNVGARAVKRHEILMSKIEDLKVNSEIWLPSTKSFVAGSNKETLLITSSIHRDMVREYLEKNQLTKQVSLLAPRLTYPFEPVISQLPKRIIFVEALEGFLEHQFAHWLVKNHAGLPIPEIHGKNIFPSAGELTVDKIQIGLDNIFNIDRKKTTQTEVNFVREGTFCPGCPHRSFFHVINDLLKDEDVIGGDIGCSSLPPHFSSWLTCMNSGASIAAGVTLAVDRKKQRTISLIGDSTLFHSGLQTLIECIQTNSDQILFILDNRWTAMTGHQPTPSTMADVDGNPFEHSLDIRTLLTAFGIKKIYEVDPRQLNRSRTLIKRLLKETTGFQCVLISRECALQESRREFHQPEPEWQENYFIVTERCQECMECYSTLTCPAILLNDEGIPTIESSLCNNCGSCYQICPNGAIFKQTKGRI